MKKMINIYCLGKYGFPTLEETIENLYSGATEYEIKYYSERLKNEIIEELKGNGFIKED